MTRSPTLPAARPRVLVRVPPPRRPGVKPALESTARKRKEKTIAEPSGAVPFTGFTQHDHELATVAQTCIAMLCPAREGRPATPSVEGTKVGGA